MRRAAALSAPVALAGCGGFDAIPTSPPLAPAAWLADQPFVRLAVAGRELVVVQPTSSAIVYGLAVLALAVGVRFLRRRDGQRSRAAWGLALLLWGLAAFLAGTSYQAFGYAIKCAGRTTCVWTSAWEIAYLVVSAWSVALLEHGIALTAETPGWRRLLHTWAIATAVGYSAAVAAGVVLASRLLLSFELLVAATAPGIVLACALSVARLRRRASPLDRALVAAWLGLGGVVLAYVAWLTLGVGGALWTHDVWFSENDVLHVGLAAWMLYLATAVLPELRDAPASPTR